MRFHFFVVVKLCSVTISMTEEYGYKNLCYSELSKLHQCHSLRKYISVNWPTVNWPTSYHLPGIIILIQDRLCREKYIMANCITLLDYSLKRLNFTSNFSNFMHVRTPSEPTKLYCTHVHVVKLVRPNCVLMCLL